MNDFLSQLAARSWGSAEMIRPRLPSFYEPAPNTVGSEGRMDVTAMFDAEERSEVAIAGPRTLRPANGVEESRLEPKRDGRVVAPEWATPLVDREGPSPTLPPPHQKGDTTGVVRPALPEASAAGSRPPVVRVLPAVLGVTPAGHPPITSAANPHGGVERPPIGGSSQPGSPERHERVAAGDRSRGVESRPEKELYLRPRPPAEDLAVRPRAPSVPQFASANRARTRAEAEGEPVIQVTIGRIEVRAASGPAPATPKARARPAVMSLDEYLRSRAKRGGE